LRISYFVMKLFAIVANQIQLRMPFGKH